jgi:peptidoglycan/xylan/chitin deacetylase (PgdA/CDA1 family)
VRSWAWWIAVALAVSAVGGCGAAPVVVARHAKPVAQAGSPSHRRIRPRGAAGAARAGAAIGAVSRRAPAGAAAGPRAVLKPPPAAIRGAASRRAAIPILMYHVVSAAPPGATYPQLWVARRRFADEMRALRRAGYHAITLATAVRAWLHGGPLPRRPIVLQFDDGYRADFTHARPVLARLGWPGVLNLVLRNLGPGGITVPQVRALIADGWEVDSHTMTHPDLTTLPSGDLRYELVASRAEIRLRFGQPARFFCYPSGRYDARVVAAVAAAGYRAATTEDEGLGVGSERFTLKRMRVSSFDTPATVLARLRAAGAP